MKNHIGFIFMTVLVLACGYWWHTQTVAVNGYAEGIPFSQFKSMYVVLGVVMLVSFVVSFAKTIKRGG